MSETVDLDSLFMGGVEALRARSPERGLALFDQVLALAPDNALAHMNRGTTLRMLGRPEDALAAFDRAVAIKPGWAEPMHGRGVVLAQLGRFDESVEACKAAGFEASAAQLQLGASLRQAGRFQEALEACDAALKRWPDAFRLHVNRANVLRALRRYSEAVAAYDHALALRPEIGAAHAAHGFAALNQEARLLLWNKALCLLALGDFKTGWALYEARKWAFDPAGPPQLAVPAWTGAEDVAGKTVLVYAEQGFGDTLHFCRYIPLLAARGARVICLAPRPLLAVLSTLKGVDRLIADDEEPPPFDFHIAMMSLPLAFGTLLETVPSEVPYLAADPARVAAWRERLGEKTRPRVGLVWAGGHRPDQPEMSGVNARRNIGLANLAPLRAVNADFYSLQKGQPAESELPALIAAGWNGPRIHDFTAELRDFADTAALMENLDLVISVDTATAHLAGALARPAFIVVRFDGCWRWMDRQESPWYGQARLFHQPAPGNWAPVAAALTAALTDRFG